MHHHHHHLPHQIITIKESLSANRDVNTVSLYGGFPRWQHRPWLRAFVFAANTSTMVLLGEEMGATECIIPDKGQKIIDTEETPSRISRIPVQQRSYTLLARCRVWATETEKRNSHWYMKICILHPFCKVNELIHDQERLEWSTVRLALVLEDTVTEDTGSGSVWEEVNTRAISCPG